MIINVKSEPGVAFLVAAKIKVIVNSMTVKGQCRIPE